LDDFDLKINDQLESNKFFTYNVTAIFGDEDARNVTVYGYTPNGTRYPVSTTIYYGLKPSVNSLSLTVEPPKTEVKTAPEDMLQGNVTATQASVKIPPQKTPEQMQREAEQGGWLSIWPEFSWWYPWFKLHVQVKLNPTVHVAFSPVLPGGESAEWSGIDVFMQLAAEVMEEIIVDVAGIFTAYLAAKALGFWNPVAGMIAEIAKASIQFGILVAMEWNDKLGLLVSALVSWIMALFAARIDLGKAFVRAITKVACASASSALLRLSTMLLEGVFVFNVACRHFIDQLEAVLDFVIGAIAYLRYRTM
jgi:hypothetical protein